MKKGYTLAEVMVALALIGVIAALTIPTFVADSYNRTYAAKLSTTITALETALFSMISNEVVNDLSETEFSSNKNAIQKYIKISNFSTSSNNCSFTLKNGAEVDYTNSSKSETKDGITYDSIGTFNIDVNSKSVKPDIKGRDQFLFRIGNDGVLHPAGSKIFSILEKSGNDTHTWYGGSSSNYACNTAGNDGCTARLIENNFVIDY